MLAAVTRRLVLVALFAALVVGCASNEGHTERVGVVTQNLLHGAACPADSNRCDLPDRVALFAFKFQFSHETRAAVYLNRIETRFYERFRYV